MPATEIISYTLEESRDYERDLAIIKNGFTNFVQVYVALMNIKERALYRREFDSFDDFCAGELQLSQGRVFELLRAQRTALESPGLPERLRESHLEELSRVPPDERAGVYAEAAQANGGRVTAKGLRAVIDRRRGVSGPSAAGDGEPAPVDRGGSPGALEGATPVIGQSRVNGVLQDDPPEIARDRAAGRIGPDVVPEIETDGGSAPEPESGREPGADDDRETPEAELTDEEWLETLPARSQLSEICRLRFDEAALAFRAMGIVREPYARQARELLRAADRKRILPNYLYQLRRHILIEHPRDWKVCPEPEDGGCDGTGELPVIGKCPHCRGDGFLL
jgi:hypothetical protein